MVVVGIWAVDQITTRTCHSNKSIFTGNKKIEMDWRWIQTSEREDWISKIKNII